MTMSPDWRVINLPDTSRNIFERGRRIAELESVAAAVHRCEAVLETAQKRAILLVYSSDRRISHDKREEAIIDGALLLTLLKGEKSLLRYLEAANNEPVMALALAKGEVAYLDRLRSSEVLAFSIKSFLSKALMPVLLIFLTALLGNLVGMILQKQSFERNRTFDVNLERLREGQRIAGNLVVSLRQIHQRIQRDEKRKELTWRPQDTLLTYKSDLGQIRNVAAGLDDENKGIAKALDAADARLTQYIDCLTNTPGNCSAQFSIDPFVDLQDALSIALIRFLS
jgi:hypothetical protein